MQTVKVKREELLTKVQENRKSHRDLFEKAQEVYREEMISELDRMLEDAKRHLKIRRSVSLPEPEDHTKDYDRIITMLVMSVDPVIELDQATFAMYVMDQWQWSASFAANTISYTSR